VEIMSQSKAVLPVEADGELIGHLPIKVKIFAKTINILIP
jgi:diacylglycerol kinase family enzyme